jgi:hypothetical protein
MEHAAVVGPDFQRAAQQMAPLVRSLLVEHADPAKVPVDSLLIALGRRGDHAAIRAKSLMSFMCQQHYHLPRVHRCEIPSIASGDCSPIASTSARNISGISALRNLRSSSAQKRLAG